MSSLQLLLVVVVVYSQAGELLLLLVQSFVGVINGDILFFSLYRWRRNCYRGERRIRLGAQRRRRLSFFLNGQHAPATDGALPRGSASSVPRPFPR